LFINGGQPQLLSIESLFKFIVHLLSVYFCFQHLEGHHMQVVNHPAGLRIMPQAMEQAILNVKIWVGSSSMLAVFATFLKSAIQLLTHLIVA
jgi:hypothetical protein